MRISEVRPSRQVKDRWLVFLDDGSVLPISEREMVSFSLYAGKELDGNTLDALQLSAGESAAKNKALSYISRRSYAKQELERRLMRDGRVSPADARTAVDWLEEIGLLNDGEFAKTLARHYAGKGYGEHKIKRELSLRGVPKEYWAAALAELGDPGAALDAFLAKKLAGRSFDDPKELKKVSDALLRRGYSWRHISEALRRHGAEIEDPGS